jgi:hypothetical protein
MEARVSVVKENGKCRVVTISDPGDAVLAPLHKALYERLTKEKWLLRGDARPQSFKGFKRKEGEVFVSGDYEAATDNLDLPTTEMVLNIILQNAVMVPVEVKQKALASLRKVLRYKGDCVAQERGQLMGNYLSFPLLCLRNYLAFKFAIPREVPVKINGDDIVFRARKAEAEKWKKLVQSCGLVLSNGKTMEDPHLFSLNSTFFSARGSRIPELIPVLRAKSLLPSPNVPTDNAFSRFLDGWARQGPSWEKKRRIVGALWLRAKKGALMVLGRGVWGLGIRAQPSQIHAAGLVPYQAFFTPRGCGRVPVDVPRLPVTKGIEGWHKESRKVVSVSPRRRREWESSVGSYFRGVSWNTLKVPTDERFKECKRTGLLACYLDFILLRMRFSRIAGMKGSTLNLPLGTPLFPEKRDVWVPDGWSAPSKVGTVIPFKKGA